MKSHYVITAHDILLRCYRRAYAKIVRYYPRLLKTPRTPHAVQVELTNACNMACPHCSRQQRLMNREIGYMELNLFKKIVDEISNYSFCHLRIGGLGEPAMHPDFHHMLDYLKDRPIKTEIVTNGTLLRRFAAKQILDWGVDILGISIDGHDEATYVRCRPNGDYPSLRRKVIALSSEKRTSNARLPEIRIRNVIFPDSTPQEIDIFRRDWLPFSDFIKFNTVNPGDCTTVLAPKRCTEIDFVFHIRWDGSVPLCGYQHWCTEEECVGNIQESYLRDVWFNSRLQHLRAAHHNADFANFEFCLRCYHTQHADRIVNNAMAWNKHHNAFISWMRRFTLQLGR